MSAKTQHNNILLAVIGFTLVVVTAGIIGVLALDRDDDTIQGEVEVSEYRVSSKAFRAVLSTYVLTKAIMCMPVIRLPFSRCRR